MPFQIIRNDITKVKADIIVNTANPKPIYGKGTDKAVYEAAGVEQLLAERKKIGLISRGDIAVTPAFQLNAKYIIHAVGPVWKDGKQGEYDILKSCYSKSLEKTVELGCSSIAFPLLATGSYGFPKDKALNIAMSVLQEFAMNHDIDIYLVVFGAKSFELSGKVFGKIQAYIDANYVKDAEEKEYSGPYGSYEQNYRRYEAEESIQKFNTPVFENKKKFSLDNIGDIFDSKEKTFQEKLFEYIDSSGMKNSDVYNAAHLSKSLFSKILCDRHYQPTKNTVLLFSIVLKLDLEQTQDLLGRAGLMLSTSNLSDMIVKACIYNKEYDFNNIDLVLINNNCTPLRKY